MPRGRRRAALWSAALSGLIISVRQRWWVRLLCCVAAGLFMLPLWLTGSFLAFLVGAERSRMLRG